MGIVKLRPTSFPPASFQHPHVGRQWPAYNLDSNLADGLILWYSGLTGLNSTRQLREITGKGPPATLVNTWTNRSDQNMGYSVPFNDGTNQYINISAANSLLPQSKGTFVFRGYILHINNEFVWDLQTPRMSLLCLGDSEPNYRYTYSAEVGNLTSENGSGNSGYNVLIGTFNDTTEVLNLYRNGVSIISGIEDPYTIGVHSGNSVIGARFSFGNNLEIGFGDFMVYDRELTITEAKQLFDPSTRWELHQPPKRLFFVSAAITPSGLLVHPGMDGGMAGMRGGMRG